MVGQNHQKRSFRISINFEDKYTADALAFARVVTANEYELDLICKRLIQRPESRYVQVLSPLNEAKAIEFLARKCLHRLNLYPQSFVENSLLMKSSLFEAFSNRRNALIVVTGEQEVAEFYLHLNAAVCPILRRNRGVDDIANALTKLPRSTTTEMDVARFAQTLSRCLV